MNAFRSSMGAVAGRSLAIFAVLAVVAAAGPIGENGGPAVCLPPLAEVVRHGDGDGTWRYCGEIPGAPVVAAGDFNKALRGQGWTLRQSVTMGRAGTPEGERPLAVWAQGDWRLLLLLWPAEPGRSGFAMGVLGESRLAEDAAREPALPPEAGSRYINFDAAAPSGPGDPLLESNGKGPRKP